MNKHFFSALFALGALALLWVATGFFPAHPLALAVTLLIAAVYGLGALELLRFRQATAGLNQALARIPDGLTELGAWLAGVPATLQNAVRLRIEGERVALPGPALTPYLVGLLVMLGMLGTFLGMVVTLNGAVFALEGTPDLAAIRSAFAAPIKGLGLAFGTSVAGVTASAVLGLLSALSRRERLLAAQTLDSKIATQLRSFSQTHQRQQTYLALQLQSQALPAVAQQLQTLMLQMERMGQQMNERLLASQESFHSHTKGVYTGLAQSVDQSLRDSLGHSAQVAADSIKPAVDAALSGIASEARLMHERMLSHTGAQLETLAARLQAEQASADSQRLQAWHSALQNMAESTQRSADKTLLDTGQLLASSEELVRARIASEAAWTAEHATRMEQLTDVLHSELAALRDAQAQAGQAAVERLGDLQTAVTQHLSTLGTALEAPITRLIATASEAPRAAAEVIAQLRQEISSSAVRDNAVLEERSRIMETLHTLLASLNHASAEQRTVIDTLVATSAQSLEQAGSAFTEKASAEAAKLSGIADQVSASAVEVSALGDSFGFAVQAFNAGNEKLMASLQRIDGALDKSMARSDEQLAYYVAQAREVIDLSTHSQMEVVDALRQLSRQQALASQASAEDA